MVMETAFYFEIHEDVGLAHDSEGNPSKTYMAVKLDVGDMTPEKYQDVQQALARNMLHTNIRPEHITPISETHYLQCTEELEEEE